MAEVKKTTKKTKETKTSSPVIARSKATKQSENKIAASRSVDSRNDKMKSTLKIAVLDITGKEVETIDLPEVLFGAKVNARLMAQAVRVYLANQRQGTASTKTRGEVDGSTRKIYRQKGTGRARHGGVRAPIFVKGGIAHGPKPRDYSLDMPVKMRRAALFSALTAKLQSGDIVVVAGLDKVEPKTRTMAKAFGILGLTKALVVMPGKVESVYKAARNIEGVTLSAAEQLNTYEVLEAKKLVLMKDALLAMQKTFVK